MNNGDLNNIIVLINGVLVVLFFSNGLLKIVKSWIPKK